MRFLLSLLLLTAPLSAFAGPDTPDPTTNKQSSVVNPVFQEPPKKSEVLEPYLTPAPPKPPEESPLSAVFRHLIIPLDSGPLFILPLVDRYKDLGITYGLMPIWAIRSKQGDTISTVHAPSILYNRYLKTTATWRSYYFPDEKRFMAARLNFSEKVDREVFVRYFDPALFGSQYRLNAEVRYFKTGRPSFYGFGPNTKVGSQANYADNKFGEEATLDIPIGKDWFLDITHSAYRRHIEDGPIDTVTQLRVAYPAVFAGAQDWRNFIFHQIAFVYDSTDHPVLPRKGMYFSLSEGVSEKWWGSSFNYRLYGLQFKKYFNINDGALVTAAHLHMQQQTGDNLPFYALPSVGESTGLRVVGDGRFVDRGRTVASLEERIRISRAPFLRFVSEMEVTPFIDAGAVYGDLSNVKLNNFHLAYGAAFRLVLRPQVVGTIDLAFGAEGPNTLVHVGYPF